MTQERKPVYKPAVNPTQITIDKPGSRSFSNDKGYFWIWDVFFNGAAHIWFVSPRMQTALTQAGIGAGATITLNDTANINPNTGRSYKGCKFTRPDGQSFESTDFEPTPADGTAPANVNGQFNGNGQQQPMQTNGNGQSQQQPVQPTNGQARPPAPTISEEVLQEHYAACLKMSMRIFAREDIQQGFEFFGLGNDVVAPETRLMAIKDVATHLSVTCERKGVFLSSIDEDEENAAPEEYQNIPAGNGFDQNDLPF